MRKQKILIKYFLLEKQIFESQLPIYYFLNPDYSALQVTYATFE